MGETGQAEWSCRRGADDRVLACEFSLSCRVHHFAVWRCLSVLLCDLLKSRRTPCRVTSPLKHVDGRR